MEREATRKLYLTVVSATGIPAKNFVNGLSSTFVKLELNQPSPLNNNSSGGGTTQQYQTTVCRNSLNPTWYQQFVFDVKDGGVLNDSNNNEERLLLTCYSHGNVYNSVLGRAELLVRAITKELEEKIFNREGEFQMTTVGEENDEKIFKGNRISKTLVLQNAKKKSLFRNNNNLDLVSMGELRVHLSLDLSDEQLAYLRKQNYVENSLLNKNLIDSSNDNSHNGFESDQESSSLQVESYAEDSSYSINQNDRLEQLRRVREKFRKDVVTAQKQSPDMVELYTRFAKIKGNISAVLKCIHTVQHQLLPKLCAATIHNEQRVNKEISEELERGTQLLRGIGNELEKIEKENKAMKEKKEEDTVEYRVRKTTHSTFVKKMSQVSSLFHSAQSSCRDAMRNKIISQIKIVDARAKEEEIEKELDNAFESGVMGSYFSKSLLEEASRHQAAKDEYYSITNVFNDLLVLERSMSALLDLFVQVSRLVAEQQTMIDDIEDFLETAQREQSGLLMKLQIQRYKRWL